MLVSPRRVAVAAGAVLLAVLTTAAGVTADGGTADGATVSAPQQRQIAETTLSSFRVVLIATRVGGSPNATVTAAGYRIVAGHWEPAGQQRIAAAGAWSWRQTEVCGLTVTELNPEPSSAPLSETLTVSLLISPARGCSKDFSKSWGAPAADTKIYVAARDSALAPGLRAASGSFLTAAAGFAGL